MNNSNGRRVYPDAQTAPSGVHPLPDQTLIPTDSVMNDNSHNDPLVRYIQDNGISKRVCNKFTMAKTKHKANLCQCGYKEVDHTPDSIKNKSAKEDTWSASTDTITLPTDAFGELEFSGFGQTLSKYVRVDHKVDVKRLLDLMLTQWQMETPNLLISVTGGAKNFSMKPRLKEVFRDGLIKAAESTGAWIVTAGSNAGVMKYVGEAVRQHGIVHGSKTRITTLGIAAWGCVNNKEALISRNGKGSWPAKYRSKDMEEREQSPLDPNHSHFILVDNGTQHKFGTEIKLRATLMRAISQMKTLGGRSDAVTVPIVCVVLEGGPNTLETVKTDILAGTPAIIVEGSGRAADILAYAYANSSEEEVEVVDKFGKKHKRVAAIYTENLWTEVRGRIIAEFGEENVETKVSAVKECILKRDHMTVFRLDGHGTTRDIDIAILHALLKVNQDNLIDQLKLALAWDRIDVAKDLIFTDDAEWNPIELEDILFAAIINNRVDFVRLLLEKGVVLKDFLTVQRLLELYNDPIVKETCPHLYKNCTKKNNTLKLKHVGELMMDLVDEYFEPLYLKDEYRHVCLEKKDKINFDNTASVVTMVNAWKNKATLHNKINASRNDFDEPHMEMFIWCVFMRMPEMAMCFWTEGKEGIALALLAQLMLQNLQEIEQDSDVVKTLDEQATYFGNIAVDTLSECYSSDRLQTTLLLVRVMRNFGDYTTLQLAVYANNENFIAHPVCQNLLNTLWMGRIQDDNQTYLVILSILCPLLAGSVLNFRDKDQVEQYDETQTRKPNEKDQSEYEFAIGQKSDQVPLSAGRVASLLSVDQGETESHSAFYNYWRKLIWFFQAPVISFAYNSIFYLAFIILFGVILLTDFRPTIDVKEMIVIVWVGTMFLEEIRQIVVEPGPMRLKLTLYVLDKWNILDLTTFTTYAAGLILRCIPISICSSCFYASRIILAIDHMLFFFRVLHIFSAHRDLGPKLVMIGRMMVDLFYFVVILLVFIASYGITSQAILYPNSPLNIDLAVDVLSQAWWDVYGQLNIDEVSGNSCASSTTNSTCNKMYTAYECAVNGYDVSECCNQDDLCPAIDWLVPILLAVYVLITNVLMLNLLIAMFSHTFSTVQDNTNVVWKMQNYQLVKEYDTRPVLPPPLIIFSHIYLVLQKIVRSCTCCGDCCSESVGNFGFRMKFNKNDPKIKRLLDWENINALEYLRKTELSTKNTLESRVKMTNDRVEAISQKVDEMAELNFLMQSTVNNAAVQPKLPPILDDRLSYLEEQMKRTSRALDWIIATLSESRVNSPPDLPDVDEQREIARKKKKVPTATLR